MSEFDAPVQTLSLRNTTLSSNSNSSIALMSLDDGVTVASVTESGSINFAANETKTVTIDGKDYTISNKQSDVSSFSYTVEDGVSKLNCSNFTITAVNQDISYNLEIIGEGNSVTTGNAADTVTMTNLTKGAISHLYTGGGDDTIVVNTHSTFVHGGDGADNIVAYKTNCYLYGENGDDEIKVTTDANQIFGGAGNDKLTVDYSINYGTYNKLYGEDGDDEFIIINGKNVLVNGGSGTNTITDTNSTNTTSINVVGANAYVESLAANETKTIIINGLSYSVKNNSGDDLDFIYKLNGDQVCFMSGNCVIRALDLDKKHDVTLEASYITYYAGNAGDTITSKMYGTTVVGGDGDDTIIGTTIANTQATFYGGKGNDYIKVKDLINTVIDGQDGDDTIEIINNTFGIGTIYGGNGNDNIIAANNNGSPIIDAGAGNDTIKTTGNKIGVFGGTGTNTIIDTGANNYYSNTTNTTPNLTEISFAENETKTITINNISYTITNKENKAKSFGYNFNEATGEITFVCSNYTITGADDANHNIVLYGNSCTLNTGNKDDKIILNGDYNYIYSNDGADTIIHNGSISNIIHSGAGNDNITSNYRNDSTIDAGDGDDTITINNDAKNVNGGNGNDTYILNGNADVTVNDSYGNNIFEVNGSNKVINAGTGDDSFVVTGSNNAINAGGGNDYFDTSGNSNKIDGGTGNNTVVDTGTGNSTTNIVPDTNNGTLYFSTTNEIQTITINDREYTITNNISTNSIKYALNSLTGEITFTGSNFDITAQDDKTHNLIIKGDNNTVVGGNLADKIIVASGSHNTINGGDGNDTLTSNSIENSLDGGTGNDTININQSSGNYAVTGGIGDDTINISSDNNTNVLAGEGNDRVYINGNSNTVDAEQGNDYISSIGTGNAITDNSGNNTINISGVTNELTTGNGNDNIVVNGSENLLNDAGGYNNTKITGSLNTYYGGVGIDKIVVSGDENYINGGEGEDNYTIKKGNNNTAEDTSAKNKIVDNGTNTTILGNITVERTLPFEVRLQVGANSDEYIDFELNLNLLDLNIDFSSAESSVETIANIDSIMNSVNNEISNVGAIMNRLESVQASQATKIENFTAAHSTIMDADIATESATLVRNQILQQTSTALMAQASMFNAQLAMSLLR